MRIQFRHVTSYTYDQEVVLEPHILRLTPRPDPSVRIEAHELQVIPEPTWRSCFLDAHGNAVCRLWFEGSTDRLVIRSEGCVETLRTNPYDFLPDADGDRLPLRWTAERGPTLPQEIIEMGMRANLEPNEVAGVVHSVTYRARKP